MIFRGGGGNRQIACTTEQGATDETRILRVAVNMLLFQKDLSNEGKSREAGRRDNNKALPVRPLCKTFR